MPRVDTVMRFGLTRSESTSSAAPSVGVEQRLSHAHEHDVDPLAVPPIARSMTRYWRDDLLGPQVAPGPRTPVTQKRQPSAHPPAMTGTGSACGPPAIATPSTVARHRARTGTCVRRRRSPSPPPARGRRSRTAPAAAGAARRAGSSSRRSWWRGAARSSAPPGGSGTAGRSAARAGSDLSGRLTDQVRHRSRTAARPARPVPVGEMPSDVSSRHPSASIRYAVSALDGRHECGSSFLASSVPESLQTSDARSASRPATVPAQLLEASRTSWDCTTEPAPPGRAAEQLLQPLGPGLLHPSSPPRNAPHGGIFPS